jgi:hypothetical protein
MLLESATDFDRALRRRFRTGVKDQRHPVAGGNFNQSATEHRPGNNINVTATAGAQQAAVVCTEEQRRSLIESRERVLAQSAPKK